MASFSIGHSTLPWEGFLSLLEIHSIEVLVDVRSIPFSQRNPQFNRKALERILGHGEIAYIFMGDQLGGRPIKEECYDQEGRADYWAMRTTPEFQNGLQGLMEHAQEKHAAFMCAEEDPLQCHRGLMITPALEKEGIEVVHIRKGGELEGPESFKNRALSNSKILKIPQSPVLFSKEMETQVFEEAFRVLAKKHAYVKPVSP